jgi:hypothetical protein
MRGGINPFRHIDPVLVASRPGSWRLSSSLHQICVRSCCASMLRQGDRAATVRCDPRFRVLSSIGTTRQVDQVPHTEAIGDFPPRRAAGRKESAQQPIQAEPPHPVLPALGATTQPLEDHRQIRRDRRLSLAKEPTGEFDQIDITPQRKPLNYAFRARIQSAEVLK